MRIVDLTMTVGPRTPVLQYDPKPEFKQCAFAEKDGWNSHTLYFHTHLGTHVDAPWHMLPDGKRISDYAIDRFVGEAVLVDVRGQKELDADLKDVEAGDIIVLWTGQTKFIGSPEYFNASPPVTMNLAKKIAEKKAGLVAIDAYSVDPPPSTIHKYFLSRDILIVENLINLDQIKKNRFKVVILPLKLDNLDGAPCRAIAQIDG
jgi:arylformamidase